MRIWDVPVEKLCQKHLCGQWREGLAIWSILNNPESKSPYLNHPEVKRWKEHLQELVVRLISTRNEMIERGYKPKWLKAWENIEIHESQLEMKVQWQSVEQQIEILKAKGCKCEV